MENMNRREQNGHPRKDKGNRPRKYNGATSPMKKSLKLRAVVSPTPAIIAAASDENGKADACTLAFYTPSSHKPPCLTIAINATAKRKTLNLAVGEKAADAFKCGLVFKKA